MDSETGFCNNSQMTRLPRAAVIHQDAVAAHQDDRQLRRIAWNWRPTLHRLELADQNITLDTLEQLCDGLKCRVAGMFED